MNTCDARTDDLIAGGLTRLSTISHPAEWQPVLELEAIPARLYFLTISRRA